MWTGLLVRSERYAHRLAAEGTVSAPRSHKASISSWVKPSSAQISLLCSPLNAGSPMGGELVFGKTPRAARKAIDPAIAVRHFLNGAPVRRPIGLGQLAKGSNLA